MTNAAPQSDQDTAKKTNSPGGDSTSTTGNQGDAKVEKDKASTAGLNEVQQAQGHPGTNNDGNAAAAATADAGDHHDGAEADDQSGESTAQAEVRQTLENGGVVANTASPEVQAKLVAEGTIPNTVVVAGESNVAVTSEVRDDGPEAGADQPGMVEKGSKSIFGSLKDGFTSLVSTVSDAGSAALNEAIDLWNNPVDTMGDWWNHIDLDKEISEDIKKTDSFKDLVTQGQKVNQEEADKLIEKRLPEGNSLEAVRQMLDEPWSNEKSEFGYDESSGAITDIDKEAGMSRVEQPDGSVTLTLKDGTVITRDSAGKETWTFKDGTIEKSADGEIRQSLGLRESLRIAADRGRAFEASLGQCTPDSCTDESDSWQNASDTEALDKIKGSLPEGVDLETVNRALDTPFFSDSVESEFDSKTQTWQDYDPASGIMRTESLDGTVTLALKDSSTVVTRNPDGSEIWRLADGSVAKSADGYSVSDSTTARVPGESAGNAELSSDEKKRFDDLVGGALEGADTVPASEMDNLLKDRVQDYDLAKQFLDNPFIDGTQSRYDAETSSFIDYHEASGMTRVEDGDGNVTLTLKDGTVIKSDAQGNTTWLTSDGVLQKSQDGTVKANFGDGATSLSAKARDMVPEVKFDENGNSDRLKSIDSDATQRRIAEHILDGTNQTADQVKDLMDVGKHPVGDNAIHKVGKDGVKYTVEDLGNGVSREVSEDGTVVVHMPGEITVSKGSDGRYTWLKGRGENGEGVIEFPPDAKGTRRGSFWGKDGTGDTANDATNMVSKMGAEDAFLDAVKNNRLDTLSGPNAQRDKDGNQFGVMTKDGHQYFYKVGPNGHIEFRQINDDNTLGSVLRYCDKRHTLVDADGNKVDLAGVFNQAADGTITVTANDRVQITSGDTVGAKVDTGDNTFLTTTTNSSGQPVLSEVTPDGVVVRTRTRDDSGEWRGTDPDGQTLVIGPNGIQTRDLNVDAEGNVTNNSTGTTYMANGDIVGFDGSMIYDSSSGSWGSDDESYYARGGMSEAQAEAAVESQVNGARTVAMPAFLEALSLGKTGGNVAGMLGRIEGGLGQISAAKALCIQLGAFDQLATLDSMMATGCAAQAQAVRVAGMEANAGIFMKGAVGNSFEMNQLRAKIANGTFISIQGEITEWNKQHENA